MLELRHFGSRAALDVPIEMLSRDDLVTWLRENHDFPTELLEPVRDIEPVSRLVEEAISRFKPYETAVDAFLVVRIHQALRITRREAADRLLWGWLGVACFPEFVTHRWAPTKGVQSLERFAGSNVRQTFARLWWGAELTRFGHDYTLTQQLFALSGVQDVYEAIFGRAFCGHYPAMRMFINEVAPAAPGVVRETAKEFSNLLTTLVLEDIPAEDLRKLLADLRHSVEKKLES
jgi:Family of unknown function (DUF6339)